MPLLFFQFYSSDITQVYSYLKINILFLFFKKNENKGEN